MDNYKGIYYNDSKEQKYFEGGAHFKYDKLFKVLLSLGGILIDEDFYNSPLDNKNNIKEKIKEDKDINYLFKKVEGKTSKFRTRNLNKFTYVNNPNTQIKFSHNTVHKKAKANLSIKDCKHINSRNINNNQIFEKNNSYFNKTVNSISSNNHKNNLNNNLIQYLMYKKEIEKKNDEKNNDSIINNYQHSIVNCIKYIHNRNRSDALANINNNNINNINNTKKIGNINKSYIKNTQNKIIINKNKNLFKNNNYLNNTNYKNNKYSLEFYGKNENDKNKQKERLIIRKSNYPLVYDKSSFLKERLKNELSFDGIKSKKSRNIINKNIVSYSNTFDNNNTAIENINYRKKYINKDLFNRLENKNKKDNDINNCSYIFSSNINNNSVINRTVSNKNNLNSYGNISKATRNKQKVSKQNGNTFMMQKYIKKKINQLCVFNQNNNGKIKNGNILTKKTNKVGDINNKYFIK